MFIVFGQITAQLCFSFSQKLTCRLDLYFGGIFGGQFYQETKLACLSNDDKLAKTECLMF